MKFLVDIDTRFRGRRKRARLMPAAADRRSPCRHWEGSGPERADHGGAGRGMALQARIAFATLVAVVAVLPFLVGELAPLIPPSRTRSRWSASARGMPLGAQGRVRRTR